MADATSPVFVTVAEDLEHEILRGTYPADTAVPSTNELARFLRINPATAGKGLNLLIERGILYKRRGIGMFVDPTARETILHRRRQEFASSFVEPLVAEAVRLDISRSTLQELIAEALNNTPTHPSTTTSEELL